MIYGDLPIKMVIFQFATLNDHTTWQRGAGWFLLWKKPIEKRMISGGIPMTLEMPRNVLRSVVKWYLLAQLIQLRGILSSSWHLLCGETKRCLLVNVLSFIASLYL